MLKLVSKLLLYLSPDLILPVLKLFLEHFLNLIVYLAFKCLRLLVFFNIILDQPLLEHLVRLKPLNQEVVSLLHGVFLVEAVIHDLL